MAVFRAGPWTSSTGITWEQCVRGTNSPAPDLMTQKPSRWSPAICILISLHVILMPAKVREPLSKRNWNSIGKTILKTQKQLKTGLTKWEIRTRKTMALPISWGQWWPTEVIRVEWQPFIHIVFLEELSLTTLSKAAHWSLFVTPQVVFVSQHLSLPCIFLFLLWGPDFFHLNVRSLGQIPCLSCSILIFQCLKHGLVYSKHSINICWMTGCISYQGYRGEKERPRSWFHEANFLVYMTKFAFR